MTPVRPIPPCDVVTELEKHILVDGFQIVIDLEKSSGARLHDACTGRDLLDCYGFFGSLPVGYNHPFFREPEVQRDLALAARARVANSDVYSQLFAQFVTTLARVASLPPLERWFFVDGGALAVENALKVAMDWKVRRNLAAGRGERGTQILHFKHAFHGRSGYTMSLTNTDPKKTDYFAKFPWPRVSTPHLDFSIADPAERDRDAARREAQSEADIREAFAAQPHEIAAILTETIQGEGGDNHFRPQWLQRLRALADELDALLIFDEVQCGFGVTGKMWACEHYGVRPDVLAFGKKVQACGIMGGPRVDEVADNCFRLPSRINSTWGGNLVDMVRSTHNLRIIEDQNLVANAAEVGETLLDGLRSIAGDEGEGLVSAVRGRGLFIAFDLPTPAARESFYRGLYDAGLLAIRSGSRSIRFRPALDFSFEAAGEALHILAEECRRVRAHSPAEDLVPA